MKNLTLFFLCLMIATSTYAKLKEGVYRGELVLNEAENIFLPFNFDVIYKGKKAQIIIRNGTEKIIVDEIRCKGDSVNFKMPVFDTEFLCVQKGDDLEGIWINHYRKEKNILKFKAQFGNSARFEYVPGKANPIFHGKWEVSFSPGTADSSKAIGLFQHLEQTDYVNGTFLTETGDYRFLEGMRTGNKLYLSCFDGSHAFLFTAQLRENGMLDGMFYSGAHWQERWYAVRNDSFELQNAESITVAKNALSEVNFSFPDINKKLVSLKDKKFENKMIIIQVMGSWCPNCMDESKYLNTLYKQYKSQGLEIVALAFEKTEDFNKASKQVERMRKNLKLDYTILFPLQTGKDKASATLQFLNKITAFPTTIFLNKQRQVVKIHTGFSGPATGIKYTEFTNNTEAFIRKILKE